MGVQPVFETPYERRGVLTPGLPILPHGVERHPIPGGGSRAVSIDKGDEISILDREGLQSGELVFFAPDGSSDAGMIGARSAGSAKQLQKTLAEGDHTGHRVLNALNASNFDLANADAIHVFSEGSNAGDMETFTASVDGLLIVCAPGAPMQPDQQNAPTELILYIRRAAPAEGKGGLAPPDPLADPLADFNIQPGQANAYEIKAGQYIQILDVQGRECSDFQAFSARALDKGLEREIDPTTTRSLMGSLYPAPGIFAKYYSVDHEPLVEIIQDTCGRHDTFGLACTARYYEDLGYPGHVNCSDNMNTDLARFDVKPRGGWPAINFFSIRSWTTPTPLVWMSHGHDRETMSCCVHSPILCVCPAPAPVMSIQPMVGTQPDIQVRVYKENEDFKRSIGFRKTAEADVEATKRTGFHDSFAKHTRDFVEYNGYWLPNTMTSHGAIAEYWGVPRKGRGHGFIPTSQVRSYWS